MGKCACECPLGSIAGERPRLRGANAQLFRLSPWHNDPVREPSGEVLYVRDEETGHFWSTAASPRGVTHRTSRATASAGAYEHVEDGIRTELTVYVALDEPIKFFTLKVSNQSGRPRRLSATGYVEWVMGDLRAKSAMHVTTEIDARNGALYARNTYDNEFADRIAFFDVDDARAAHLRPHRISGPQRNLE
jgi:cellobiose phosphorylase